MVNFVQENASDRKLRLFAVACCRINEHLLPNNNLRDSIGVIEDYADGLANNKDLQKVYTYADRLTSSLKDFLAVFSTRSVAVAASMTSNFAFQARELSDMLYSQTKPWQHPTAWDLHIPLLHEIFGNPFQTAQTRFKLKSESRTVVKLAKKLYDKKEFEQMPLLAEALEKAGCSDHDLVSHCRAKVVHVRGCWALDLILGKE
jgi:hypothetical protein